MATVQCVGGSPSTANLCTTQAGNGATTNIVDRGPIGTNTALLRLATVAGTTCTYLVEGSANGTDWAPAPITDPATPETVSVATFVITTTTTTLKYLRPGHPWRFLRVTMSANTGMTSTIDLWTF